MWLNLDQRQPRTRSQSPTGRDTATLGTSEGDRSGATQVCFYIREKRRCPHGGHCKFLHTAQPKSPIEPKGAPAEPKVRPAVVAGAVVVVDDERRVNCAPETAGTKSSLRSCRPVAPRGRDEFEALHMNRER